MGLMKPIWSSALESMGNHFKEKHLKYLRLFILLRILLQLLGARLLRDNLVCNTMHLTSKRLVYLFRTEQYVFLLKAMRMGLEIKSVLKSKWNTGVSKTSLRFSQGTKQPAIRF